MFRNLFTPRATTKADIVMAIGACIIAIMKAVDTVNTYNKEKNQ